MRTRVIAWRGIEVPAYTLMLTIGCVLGTYAGLAFGVATGLPAMTTLLAIVLLLPIALVGARLWFVLAHLSHYRGDLSRLFRHSEGGSGLYGGLILAFVASIPVLAVLQLPFWRFWDAAVVTMLVGLAITRVGCTANGCCAGRATAGPLGLNLPGASGAWTRRVPTQLLESAWAVLILLGVLLLHPYFGPGECLAAVVALYGAGRLVLEPLREKSGARVANLAVSFALFVVGTLYLTIGGMN